MRIECRLMRWNVCRYYVVFLFQKLKGFQKADRHQKAPLVLKRKGAFLTTLVTRAGGQLHRHMFASTLENAGAPLLLMNDSLALSVAACSHPRCSCPRPDSLQTP